MALVHAVIVTAYAEPYDVLATTVKSLRSNTLVGRCVLVLGMEARDPHAEATFKRLKAQYGRRFRDVLMTSHVLVPGEVAGKASNERHACIQLYKYAQSAGLDPYSVMVTTCDADSQFDSVFLEQLESEFHATPDGRHTLFDSPINTYSNLAACHPMIAVFEIQRSQHHTFSALQVRPPLHLPSISPPSPLHLAFTSRGTSPSRRSSTTRASPTTPSPSASPT